MSNQNSAGPPENFNGLAAENQQATGAPIPPASAASGGREGPTVSQIADAIVKKMPVPVKNPQILKETEDFVTLYYAMKIYKILKPDLASNLDAAMQRLLVGQGQNAPNAEAIRNMYASLEVDLAAMQGEDGGRQLAQVLKQLSAKIQARRSRTGNPSIQQQQAQQQPQLAAPPTQPLQFVAQPPQQAQQPQYESQATLLQGYTPFLPGGSQQVIQVPIQQGQQVTSPPGSVMPGTGGNGGSGGGGGGASQKSGKATAKATKRAAEGAPGDEPTEPKKKKSSSKKKASAANKAGDEDEEGEGGVGAPKLSFFEEERETNLLMKDIERRRKDGTAKACPVQLLSEWRVANESLRQLKAKSGGGARGVGRSTERQSSSTTGLDGVGLDQAVLDALQYAFKAHAQAVLTRAERIARHRATTAQRPEAYEASKDIRRQLGTLKKNEEAAAEKKAAEERDALLKAAGSKRADEETRERAQRAKAELVGQQQAVAANKALAATMGGKDAKWAKWGGGGGGTSKKAAPAQTDATAAKITASQAPEAAVAATAARETGYTTVSIAAEDGAATATGEQREEGMPTSRSASGLLQAASGNLPASTAGAGPSAPAALQGGDAGGGDSAASVRLEDLIAALQQDPAYSQSPLLYRLLNGMM